MMNNLPFNDINSQHLLSACGVLGQGLRTLQTQPTFLAVTSYKLLLFLLPANENTDVLSGWVTVKVTINYIELECRMAISESGVTNLAFLSKFSGF